MTEKEQQFNKWFDEYANGVKVFEEADMKQAYLQGWAELEKENAELKADNDARKFAMAMSEKVEKQLRQENAELKDDNKVMADNYSEMEQKFYNNLTKAKVALRNVIDYLGQFCSDYPDCVIEAEQFLSEVEK